MALQKALYYSQGFGYAFYKEYLFPNECEAWIQGPIYKDIYFRYRDYKFDPIKKNEKYDYSKLSKNEMHILDSVAKDICCYSGKTLEAFTHLEKPWLLSRCEISLDTPSNSIIEKNDRKLF